MQIETFDIPSVIFCSSQRSGSTMMVDDLSRLTGRERFETHENFCRMIDDGLFANADWPEIQTRLRERIAKEREGLFIENIMHDHASTVSEKLSPSGHDEALTPFYRFFRNAVWVRVKRVDTFEQAISKFFAAESGVWDKRQVTDKNDYNDAIEYDFEKLYKFFSWFRDSQKKWDFFFQAHGLEPITLYYEEAKDSYPDYLKPIFEKLEFDFPADVPERRLKKLGNQRNLLFKEKFLKDLFDRTSGEITANLAGNQEWERHYHDILSSRSYKIAQVISKLYRTVTGKN